MHMKTFLAYSSSILIALTLMLGGTSEAYAKRFGGGKSFGGKSFYSSPYRRSTSNQTNKTAQQQQDQQKNAAVRQQLSRRSGLLGMLGGLAIGGLLGSMLFGGAFESFNLLDILFFGGIAYLFFRIFAANQPSRRPVSSSGMYDQPHAGPDTFENRAQPTDHSRYNAFDTDLLFDKDRPTPSRNELQSLELPRGFVEKDFLSGAEQAFRQLQQAWDANDLTTIRSLATDTVFADIQEQLQTSAESNRTDILKIQAELLDVREFGLSTEAVVLFDCILRENPQDQAKQVREVWHFVSNQAQGQASWLLDGIQQLED